MRKRTRLTWMTIGLIVGGLLISWEPAASGASAEAQTVVPAPTPGSAATDPAAIAPGRIVVKFRSDASAKNIAAVLRDEGLTEGKAVGRSGAHVLRGQTGHEREVIGRLEQRSIVQYAEPDYVVKATAPAVPTDPLYSSQWDMPKIDMPDAWGLTIGNNIKVAVIDTGIQMTNPDLATQWVYAAGHAPSDHVFLSTPLSSGCSIPSQPSDDDGHGTHVSGTIAAASTLSGAPAFGVAGMAPGARIIPLKVLDCQGSGYLSDAADAIDFAVQNGASVINMSLGAVLTGGCPSYLQTAITNAVSNGVFVAAAAGNDGNTSVEVPAGCTGAVGVGATDSNDAHASFSNRNTSVALSAPGVSIISTWNDGTFRTASGTSMSTPHAAACAALVKAANPSLTAPSILSVLENTAVDLGTPGYDTTFGYGRVNCGAAVAQASGTTNSNPTSTPTTTPTAGTIGGKGLTISTSASGVLLSWQGGTAQTGYTLARLSGSALNVLSTFGPLPASATSYVDSTATGPNCYALFVLGVVPQPVSDFECAIVGFHSPTGSPQNFSLQLNQSSLASLSWAPPATGGQDGYLLVQIGGGTQTFTGATTQATELASGLTCYVLGATHGGAIIGYTDVLCGSPGFTNMTAASAK